MQSVLMLWTVLRHGCCYWQRAAQGAHGHTPLPAAAQDMPSSEPAAALPSADICSHPAIVLSLAWCRLQIWSEVKAEKAKAAKAKAAKEHSHSDKH